MPCTGRDANAKWLSVAQNTSDTPVSINAQGKGRKYLIKYPAKSDGTVFLHPGPKGEKVVAQYTAADDGNHMFKYDMALIMESPTGVGVNIYGPQGNGSAPLWTKAEGRVWVADAYSAEFVAGVAAYISVETPGNQMSTFRVASSASYDVEIYDPLADF